MKVITVSSAAQLTAVLKQHNLTPTPLPQSDEIIIGELTILRDVVERTFRECGHSISTTRFPNESDWCAVCEAEHTIE